MQLPQDESNNWTLTECMQQLEWCKFTDELGHQLENNVAFLRLSVLAKDELTPKNESQPDTSTESEDIAKSCLNAAISKLRRKEGPDIEKAVALIETARKQIATAIRKARLDELKRTASHNNSEYTSDYLEDRIAELEATLNSEDVSHG